MQLGYEFCAGGVLDAVIGPETRFIGFAAVSGIDYDCCVDEGLLAGMV